MGWAEGFQHQATWSDGSLVGAPPSVARAGLTVGGGSGGREAEGRLPLCPREEARMVEAGGW